MTVSHSIRNWNPKPLQILAVLLVMQLIAALFTDGFALSFDEAMWHYIGRNWFRNGLVPYSGGVDNKSPLIFAIFGLSDKLFGVNYWFPRVLGAICQSVGVYYVYKLTKHIYGEHCGLLAMALYGLSLLWHSTGGKYVSYTETYEVLFTILAIHKYLVAKNNRQIFICGLLAGIAPAFRLTGVFGMLAILIFCLRQNRKYALIFCIGVLSSVAALLICGLIAGIGSHDLLAYGLLDNFSSGSATDHTLVWKWHNFSAKFLRSGMLLFCPLILGYFLVRRRFDFFALWLILEFAGICLIGIFDNVHLKEVLPPLAIMSAFCFKAIINKYKLPATFVYLALVMIFFPNLTEQWGNLRKTVSGFKMKEQRFCAAPYLIPDEGIRKQLGWWIRDNSAADDKVYIAGFGAQVQAYSERISPTIYFNVTQTPLAKARLFADLQSNKPQMILVPMFTDYKQNVSADIRNFIEGLITKDYQPQGCVYNYMVYKIKATAP
jgi:hypothetical protein